MKTEKQIRTWHVNGDHLWTGASLGKNAAISDTDDIDDPDNYCVAVVRLKDHEEIVAELEERIQKLQYALKFYADKKNWLREPSADIARRIGAIDCSSVKGYSELTGGRLAREALKED